MLCVLVSGLDFSPTPGAREHQTGPGAGMQRRKVDGNLNGFTPLIGRRPGNLSGYTKKDRASAHMVC